MLEKVFFSVLSVQAKLFNKVVKKNILAHIAQVVEHVLGKDEVIGSSPISSSRVAWFASAVRLVS